MQNLIALFESGGFVMYPLLICSLAIWAVIFERSWRFRSLSRNLEPFYSKAVELALKNDRKDLERHCLENGSLPTSRVISEAIHRLGSDNVKVRKNWLRAVERKRLAENQDLKKGLWVLGTIGSAAPFWTFRDSTRDFTVLWGYCENRKRGIRCGCRWNF